MAAGDDALPKDESGGATPGVIAAETSSIHFVATLLENDLQFALVRSDLSGVHRVQVGDNVDGWDVVHIDVARVSLASLDGGKLELEPPEKPQFTMVEAPVDQANGPGKGRGKARGEGQGPPPAVNNRRASGPDSRSQVARGNGKERNRPQGRNISPAAEAEQASTPDEGAYDPVKAQKGFEALQRSLGLPIVEDAGE